MSKWREIAALCVLGGVILGALIVGVQAYRREWLERLGPLARWRSAAIAAVVLGAIAALAVTLFISWTQARRWVYPERNQVAYTPAEQGILSWEDVHFETSDGIEIVAWFIPATDSDGATVILVHGLGGHRGALLSQAKILNAHGYHSLLIDLRDHGESGGSVMTLGYSEVEDIRAAVTYLTSRPDVNLDRLAILGHSLGGVAAVHAAAQIPDIDAVVAQSTFSSTESSWQQIVSNLTGMPPAPWVLQFVDLETGVPASQIDLLPDIAAIAPRPMLFIHGAQDNIVSPDHSQRMYAMAAEPKALFIIDGAGHTGLEAADPADFESQLIGFLDQSLR